MVSNKAVWLGAFFCGLSLGLASVLAAESPAPQQAAPIATSLQLQITGLPADCLTLQAHLQHRAATTAASLELSVPVSLGPQGWQAQLELGYPWLLYLQHSSLQARCGQQIRQITRLPAYAALLQLNYQSDFQPTSAADTSNFSPAPSLSAEQKQNLQQQCRQPAAARFFETQGADYSLSLGGPAVPIIGRKSWGAGPVITAGRSFKAYDPALPFCPQVQRITVHHTHTALEILALQQFHQTQADPKADIGYHFYISHTGQIFEARPLGYMGSHAEADNSGNIGIVLNGDFSEQPPAQAQLLALEKLLAALQCPCGLTEGLWTHRQRKALRFPQQPQHQTTCPGDQLASQVHSLALKYGFGPLSFSSAP